MPALEQIKDVHIRSEQVTPHIIPLILQSALLQLLSVLKVKQLASFRAFGSTAVLHLNRQVLLRQNLPELQHI